MSAAENRTLQIRASFRDQASPEFRKLQVAANNAASRIAAGFRGAVGILTSAKAAVVGLFAAFAAQRALRAVQSVADGLDDLAKASDNLGITAESLQQVRDQAELAGVKFEELTTGLKFFERNVEQAQLGTVAQAQALRLLGLSADDFAGSQLDAVDVLAKVADGLKGVDDATTRTRILMDLFGRSGSQLGALLSKGGDGIRQLAEEATRAGIIFSRDELARVEAYNDSLTRVRQAFQHLAEGIMVEIAPTLSTLFDDLARNVAGNTGSMRSAFLDLSRGIVDTLETIAKAAAELGGMLERTASFVQDWAGRFGIVAASVKQTWAQMFGTDADAKAAEQRLWDLYNAHVRLSDEVQVASKATEERVKAVSEAFAGLRQRIEAARNAQAQPVQQGGTTTVEGEVSEETDRGLENLTLGIEKASRSWRDFNQAAFDAGQQLVNGPLAAFDDALAGIIDGTKSASEAWRAFGQQTLRILAQVIAKLITVKLLSSLFGSGGGGAGIAVARADGGVDEGGVTRLLPVRGFARGGIVRRPTMALIGEGAAPAEAFVPLPDGRSIPVDFGGGAPGGRTVNVNITAMDSRDVTRVLSEQRGLLRMFAADDLDRRVDVRHGTKKAVR